MNIPLRHRGYEADDVWCIGNKLRKNGRLRSIYGYPPDKDYGQMVSKNLKIYNSHTRGVR